MSNSILSFSTCILVLFFGASNFCFAQKPAVTNKDLGAMQLEDLRVEAQSVGSLFSHISLSYDIPIGLEIPLNDNEFNTYNFDFKKGTLSDLLTQFVNQHNQYDWEIKDGIVNIFPKDNYRDFVLNELLETEISRFLIKEKTSCWNLSKDLASTPEIRKVLELYSVNYSAGDPSGFYIQQAGQHFTLDVANMKLKSILNKVVKESPVAKIWIMKRYEGQTVFLKLIARFEDSSIKGST